MICIKKVMTSFITHPYQFFLLTPQDRLNNELQQLVKDVWRVGDPTNPAVSFGELFNDDEVQQHYEGLAATLKAAKKRKWLYLPLYFCLYLISFIHIYTSCAHTC